MDVSAITSKILENARLNAESYLNEARARVDGMLSAADDFESEAKVKARRLAREEGDRLEQNLRRMAALEDRKSLLILKHQLIDESFEQALRDLQGLPDDQLRSLFMAQVLRAAQGGERLIVGAIRPGFFQGFVDEANQRLEGLGKPAGLTDAGQQRAGVCGVILTAPGYETHCTIDMLLNRQRDSLEAEVAAIVASQLS